MQQPPAQLGQTGAGGAGAGRALTQAPLVQKLPGGHGAQVPPLLPHRAALWLAGGRQKVVPAMQQPPGHVQAAADTALLSCRTGRPSRAAATAVPSARRTPRRDVCDASIFAN